jgi:hypothetical protein
VRKLLSNGLSVSDFLCRYSFCHWPFTANSLMT